MTSYWLTSFISGEQDTPQDTPQDDSLENIIKHTADIIKKYEEMIVSLNISTIKYIPGFIENLINSKSYNDLIFVLKHKLATPTHSDLVSIILNRNKEAVNIFEKLGFQLNKILENEDLARHKAYQYVVDNSVEGLEYLVKFGYCLTQNELSLAVAKDRVDVYKYLMDMGIKQIHMLSYTVRLSLEEFQRIESFGFNVVDERYIWNCGSNFKLFKYMMKKKYSTFSR